MTKGPCVVPLYQSSLDSELVSNIAVLFALVIVCDAFKYLGSNEKICGPTAISRTLDYLRKVIP